MAAAEQRNGTELDLGALTDEHLTDVLDDPGTKRLDRPVLHLHLLYFLFSDPVPVQVDVTCYRTR